MSRRRRTRSTNVYSISCTDAEWEHVRRLAKRRGTSISRYFVECGLNVDLKTERDAPPRLVLDAAEQRTLSENIARIAERTAPPGSAEAVLTRIRNSLALLVELAMRDMVRGGREGELRSLLTALVGEGLAAATIERLHTRMENDPPGT